MFPNYKNAWNAQSHTRQETAEVRVKKKQKQKKQKCVWFSWYICIFWSNDLENEERASELKHCVTRAVVFLYWSLAWINNPKTNTAPSSKSSLDITRRRKERTVRRGGFIFLILSGWWTAEGFSDRRSDSAPWRDAASGLKCFLITQQSHVQRALKHYFFFYIHINRNTHNSQRELVF